MWLSCLILVIFIKGNFKQKLMKHSKENLKIGTRYHIGDNLVGTYIGKGVDGDVNFSVNVGIQVRHFSIRPNNQKEYYKVCLFGQYFRLFLLILSLSPIFGYFYIDISQYGEISEILGFIWLVCYMAVLGIVFWSSNLIKKIKR